MKIEQQDLKERLFKHMRDRMFTGNTIKVLTATKTVIRRKLREVKA